MDTNEIRNKAKQWLQEPFDKETQIEIKKLIDKNSDDLTDRFYKNMEFGTGGMRGIMGAGTNRINRYTLGKNTQGISNYLTREFPNKQLKVAIAYDCRHNSKLFARACAEVFSANNIYVYLFEDLRPTPELSYAVRELNCDAGIILTASHNPPEYNGYKVYFNDGGQIIPPQDGEIINEINSLDFSDIKFKANDELIEVIGEEIDSKFTKEAVLNSTSESTKNRKDLKIVFTSLHGTSITIMPGAFKEAGYTDVHIVEEQREPNGDFPTVESPNPEEPAALKMATDLAEKIGADIVIGTDPDCDRLGIAVRDLNNNMVLLNGNQTFALLVNSLIKDWDAKGKLNGNQFVGSTIVSTPMINEIATSYGVETKVVLTGFKWIAKTIREAEGKQDFIGGGEESFGFMVGDFVRDKDAVSATLLACEIAAQAKAKGSSMYMELLELYKKHGANPMGGCLPLILQIPVFFAIYRVLLNSIELKGAEWIFWIHDLAEMDPYFVLPILMGASMYLQQKITPNTMQDEMQKKIFQMLPIVFTFFFLWFPAGLTLYWFVNNVFTISQQYYINSVFEKQRAAKK